MLLEPLCIDDICAALPVSEIDQFLGHLNSIELCIQLIAEIEHDSRLPFLDVLLHRSETGDICTSVYHKAMHTDHIHIPLPI